MLELAWWAALRIVGEGGLGAATPKCIRARQFVSCMYWKAFRAGRRTRTGDGRTAVDIDHCCVYRAVFRFLRPTVSHRGCVQLDSTVRRSFFITAFIIDSKCLVV